MNKHPRSIYAIIGIAAILLALSCGLGSAMIERGALAPPELNINLGLVRLVGKTSLIPECSQLINPGCVAVDPVPPLRIYTLWLVLPSTPGRPQSAELRRLLTLRRDTRVGAEQGWQRVP